MYSTSTQKKHWTFTPEQLCERRKKANEKARASRLEFVNEEESEMFLSVEDEILLTRIVENFALKFADNFHPPIWNSVRWTAYMYYKRLYLDWSAMDFMPKNAMMACFYLAMKTDEFFVTIEEFVRNLQFVDVGRLVTFFRSGSTEQNMTKILAMEPDIMRSLNYQLTVHCPYRPFEGHLMEMKTRMLLNFDLEAIRPAADDFFRMCLLGDAMLMYPPSQISLAAVKYGLNFIQKPDEVLREFILKLMGVEDDYQGEQTETVEHAEKLLKRLEEILAHVASTSQTILQDAQSNLLNRAKNLVGLESIIENRRVLSRGQERRREEPIDSDDD